MRLAFSCDHCGDEFHVDGDEQRGLPVLIDCPCGGLLSLLEVSMPLEVFGADLDSI
jgi:hypothetical protein